jgi:hypothetical protein
MRKESMDLLAGNSVVVIAKLFAIRHLF